MMRKFFLFFCLVAGIALVGRGWHWAKDGFNIRRVRAAFPAEQTENLSISADIKKALQQPYSYLGQGRQYYVFASEDGRYVLKLPRLDRYEVPFWLAAAPFPFLREYRERVGRQRQQRLRFLLESARIAFEELQEQTAVVFLHFYKTQCFEAKTAVSDRLGRSYLLDLDAVPFVLQEKKGLMAQAFEDSLKMGDREKSEEILESFLHLIAYRSKRGIFNKDHSLLRNYGFGGTKGFEIDIGSFYRLEQGSLKSAFQETVEHLRPWLGQIDPDLQTWFDRKAGEIGGCAS